MLGIFSYAQQNISDLVATDQNDKVTSAVVLNNEVILSYCTKESFYLFEEDCQFVKMNLEGEVLDIIPIPKRDSLKLFALYGMVTHNNEVFAYHQYVKEDTTLLMSLYKYDEDMNLLDSVDLFNHKSTFFTYYQSPENTLIHIQADDNIRDTTYVSEMDYNLNELHNISVGINYPSSYYIPFNKIYYNSVDSFIQLVSFLHNIRRRINKTTFELDTTIYYTTNNAGLNNRVSATKAPSYFGEYCNNDSTSYNWDAGTSSKNGVEKIIVSKLLPNDTFEVVSVLPLPSKNCAIGHKRGYCVDHSDNSYYFGYAHSIMANVVSSGFYIGPAYDTQVEFHCINEDGSLRWQNSFGGGAQYHVEKMIALPNNKMMAFVEYYEEFVSNGLEKDVFVLIFDENGNYKTLSLEESFNKEKNKIDLYPNPTSNIVQIKNKRSQKIKQIEIYNSLGQRLDLTSKENEIISLADYPSGLYQIKIEWEDGRRVTKKVVKE